MRLNGIMSLAFIFVFSAGIGVGQSQSTGSVTDTQAAQSTSTNSTQTDLIPSGTTLSVRVNDNLSSETTTEGSQWSGTLAADLTTNDGRIIFPRGADVTGRVITARPSGRVSDSGELDLTVNTIRSGAQSANIHVTPFVIKGQSHTRSNTEKIGGGAVLGAIIGGIAGGGKGAAIGAGVGAGAGGAGAAATGKQPASVESEAVLQFNTSTDASVYGAGSQNGQNSSTLGNDGLRRHAGSGGQAAAPAQPAINPLGNSASQCNDFGGDFQSFTARDRRVINSCYADNRAAFPATQNYNSGGNYADQPTKNQVLPASLQNKVRALPLACDRQLMPLPPNMERVYYNNQVMLLDGSGRVIDLFTLNTP